MKNMELFLAVLFIVVGSPTTASATIVGGTMSEVQKRENLPQVLTEVLRCEPEPMKAAKQYILQDEWYDQDGDTFPPNYSNGTRDLMYTAYKILFLSHPEADWNGMVNYMWWVVNWGREGSGYRTYADEFSRENGVTADNAGAFWSWRQELLRQARAFMDDPTAVRAIYKKYKILLMTVAGWGARKYEALRRLDTILAIIRGTHELCPELMVAWSSESRDGAYNHNKHGFYKPYDNQDYWKSIDRRETTEWFYFIERRKVVGGDELMKAYEEILADYIESVANNDFKFM